MNDAQKQQGAAMSRQENDFVLMLTMFRSDEREQVLEAIRAAVKGGATA